MVIGSRHEQYKDATAHVVNWIRGCTNQVLCALKRTSPEAFAHHAGLFDEVRACIEASCRPRVRMVYDMLRTLAYLHDAHGGSVFSVHGCLKYFKSLPKALSSCNRAIELRNETYRFFERATDYSDQYKLDSNKKHLHFIKVMKEWYRELTEIERTAKRNARAEPVPAPRAEPGPAPRAEPGPAPLHLPFAGINLTITPQGKPNTKEGENGGRATRPELYQNIMQPEEGIIDNTDLHRLQVEEEPNADFCDIQFVLQMLIVDMDEIMKKVAGAWREVRDGTSNYVCASLVSLLAFRQVKDLTAALAVELPDIQSFEDLESVVSYSGTDEAKVGDLEVRGVSSMEEKLGQYMQTLEYPERSVMMAMSVIAENLRQFITEVPTQRGINMLRSLVDDSFDEMVRPVTDLKDFLRVLREQLAIMHNVQLCPYRVFENYDGGDDEPLFLLLKEVLDEFLTHFTPGPNHPHRRTSIPLVFLTTIWYHSVQLLQGGMRLSRMTAITHRALRDFVRSMDCGHELHGDAGKAIYFRLAAERARFLGEHTSFYRNHPLAAGAIALDVSVSLSVKAGEVQRSASMEIRYLLHLYNALMKSDRLPPSPVIEKYLERHWHAFFEPVRPSRSFFSVMPNRPPKLMPATVSELYRILIRCDNTSLRSCGSFNERVQYVCTLWNREFYKTTVLAFDHCEFARAMMSIAQYVMGPMQAWIQSDWEQWFLLTFIILKGNNDSLPYARKCIENMANRLAELSASATSFDLLPRVNTSMQALVYGPPAKLVEQPVSAADHARFSTLIQLFESGTGPLTREDQARVFNTCRDHPVILRVFDKGIGGPHLLHTTVVNHVAGGPRANTELLEDLLQLDALRVRGPVGAAHACAAAGNETNLDMVLAARNYTEVNLECAHRRNTPLHYAAQFGHVGVIELLKFLSVNTAASNADGRTAMEIACSDDVRAALAEIDVLYEQAVDTGIRDGSGSSDGERESRFSARIHANREQLQRTLSRRSEDNRPIHRITAADEALAKKAEAELLEMEEKEKTANATARNRRGRKKRGRGGKGRKR